MHACCRHSTVSHNNTCMLQIKQMVVTGCRTIFLCISLQRSYLWSLRFYEGLRMTCQQRSQMVCPLQQALRCFLEVLLSSSFSFSQPKVYLLWQNNVAAAEWQRLFFTDGLPLRLSLSLPLSTGMTHAEVSSADSQARRKDTVDKDANSLLNSVKAYVSAQWNKCRASR